MKVVGFVGSPRKQGNTDEIVKKILAGAKGEGAETKIFYLNELDFKGCQACGACKVNGKCTVDDDMRSIYDEIAGADGIVIGSPVYMWGITGQTKLFLDRWYALMNPDLSSRLEKGKKAVLVFPQGNPNGDFFRGAINSTSQLMGMFGLEVKEVMVVPGVMEPGAVKFQEQLMVKAYEVGTELVN